MLATVHRNTGTEPVVDAEAFRRDGFLVVRNVLSAEELAPYQSAWSALERSFNGARKFEGGKTQVWTLPPEIDRFVLEPKLVSIAVQILGPDVCVYQRRALLKDTAFRGAVEPHQDMAYSIGNPDKILVMLALSECDEANGALWYVKGSHRYGYMSNRGTIDLRKFPHLECICPQLSPGDVLIGHNYAWHYSEMATNDRPRVMLNAFYQPATDGNYVGATSEEPPMLVAGEWRTEHFWNYRSTGTPFVE